MRAVNVGALLTLLSGLQPGLVAQEKAVPGAVTGKVVAQESGDGLGDVEVRLAGTSLLAVTNERGYFRMDPVPSGPYVLTFARLGYEDRADSVSIPAGAVFVVEASLSTQPIELDDLVVAVRSLVLERGGYYAREAQGYRGHFLDRQEIERRNPDVVSDLFRRISGIRVVYGGIYGSQVLVNQNVVFSDGTGCEPSIWLDGIRSTMRTPDIMRVEELEGIEVYTGATSPGKFNDICGVIVMWTRLRVRR